ncbi:MAG: hypothetical protein KC503_12490 [Myxococcales bacterium]|nr:hypothetical protein [Myxococcales bacterium]
MALCSICKNTTLAGEPYIKMQTCDACARRLGLIPMPPATRRQRPCGACNGQQFIRAILREHSTDRAGELNGQVSAPMYVTYRPDLHEGWVMRYAKYLAIESAGLGLLEAYICRGCGDVQFRCVDVENIPIGPQYMTELVDVGGDDPYR